MARHAPSPSPDATTCTPRASRCTLPILVLYQLAVSPYCEKIRRALDHKRLPHRIVTLLRGPRAAEMKREGLASSLPVLEHDGTLIRNSSDIIDYLDEKFAYPTPRAKSLDRRPRSALQAAHAGSCPPVSPLFRSPAPPRHVVPSRRAHVRYFESRQISRLYGLSALQKLDEVIQSIRREHQRQPS